MSDEKVNAKQHARIFYAKHMQPGIARYEDETILVDTDAIKKMLPTAIGKPVYINHQNVKLETLKNDAAGYITDAFYNELDGWAWFKIIAVDDQAHNAISNGWKVSNAYVPYDFGNGGTKNNCPYDREILNGDFTHLAIVDAPRYENADILTPEEFKSYQEAKRKELDEYKNSLPTKKESKMFKLFKMIKTEVKEADADTFIELADGKSVKISEMVNAVENAEKKNEDDMDVMVNGKKMKLSSLKEKYNKMKKNESPQDEEEDEDEEDEGVKKENKKSKVKKNAEDEEDKENSDSEDEDAEDEDAEDEDKEKKSKKEKKNSSGKDDKFFDEIANANRKVTQPVTIVETSMDKLARGKSRYSL